MQEVSACEWIVAIPMVWAVIKFGNHRRWNTVFHWFLPYSNVKADHWYRFDVEKLGMNLPDENISKGKYQNSPYVLAVLQMRTEKKTSNINSGPIKTISIRSSPTKNAHFRLFTLFLQKWREYPHMKSGPPVFKPPFLFFSFSLIPPFLFFPSFPNQLSSPNPPYLTPIWLGKKKRKEK